MSKLIDSVEIPNYCFLVDGGIGDILLCGEGIQELLDTYDPENLSCLLFSHYKQAPRLLDPYNIPVFFWHYEDNDDYQRIFKEKIAVLQDSSHFLGHAKLYGSSSNPTIRWPHDFRRIKVPKRAIAIHPFGSPFSKFWLTTQRNDAFSKDFTHEFLGKLVEQITTRFGNDVDIYIIGAPSERKWFDEFLGYHDSPLLVPVFEEDIWTAFDVINQCEVLIAADSAMKSLTTIQGYPSTIVLLGNYADPTRDQLFIKPYEDFLELIHMSGPPGEAEAIACDNILSRIMP